MTQPHATLLQAAIAARKAAKAYYAYRPKTDMDLDRKAELLKESRQKERELDAVIKDQVNGQGNLFNDTLPK